jgi:hypothetical protein
MSIFALIFSPTCLKTKFRKFSIYSKKFFHNFHLSVYDVMVLHILNKSLIEQSNWHYCKKFTLAILRLRFQLFNFKQDKTYYLMFIVVVFELYSWHDSLHANPLRLECETWEWLLVACCKASSSDPFQIYNIMRHSKLVHLLTQCNLFTIEHELAPCQSLP